jgi:serine/threonine protein kinase
MTDTKKGGEFLGEGSYGCTFLPAVNCQAKEGRSVNNDGRQVRNEKKLTKVFWSNEDVEDEWKFAKLIRDVDPKQRYFIYPNERCTVAKKDILKQPNAMDCNNLRILSQKTVKLPVLQMKYGGVTLEKWVQMKRRKFVEFLPMLRHILVGIGKLHRKGYLHHDLKIDNILIDDNNVPHIIDYSLLTPLKGAFDSSVNTSLQSRYWLHPPEYRLQNFSKMTDVDGDLPRFVSKHVQNETDLYYFKIQPNDISTVNQFLLAYFPYCEMYDITKKYVKTLLSIYNVGGKEGLIKYQSKNATKVDVYAVGLTMMNIIYHMDTPANDSRFRSLIIGMIHPDPRKRYSVGKCITCIEDLMGAYNISE